MSWPRTQLRPVGGVTNTSATSLDWPWVDDVELRGAVTLGVYEQLLARPGVGVIPNRRL